MDGMGKSDTGGQSVAKGVVGFVLAVVAVNVLLRIAPLPDLDLPSISLPDVPGWVRAVLKAKNWAVLAIVALIVIGFEVEQLGERRKRARRDAT